MQKDYLGKLITILKNKFNLTDYEVEFLQKLNEELRRPLPATKVGLEERSNALDICKLDLHNMLFMLENKFAEMNYEFKEKYNVEHTRLVRAGRPSEAAIEAEIFTNKALKSQHDLLNDWENFRNLLTSYLSVVKAYKESCLNKFV